MDKLDEFKEFIKDKPFLREKVNNKETTWQSLYETYDLFGKDADVFKEDKISGNNVRNNSNNGNNSILKMLEGVNLDKSLKRTRFDFDYIIPDYEIMISELSEWTKKHNNLYTHYCLWG